LGAGGSSDTAGNDFTDCFGLDGGGTGFVPMGWGAFSDFTWGYMYITI